MARTFLHHAAESRFGVKLLIVGVAIVLAAQCWSAVPIAGAVALVAWGTALNAANRRDLLLLAALVYTPLGIITVMSQVDLAMDASAGWAVLAGLDAAAGITLLYHLACRTGNVLAYGWRA